MPYTNASGANAGPGGGYQPKAGKAPGAAPRGGSSVRQGKGASLADIDAALRAPGGWDDAKVAPIPPFLFASPFALGAKVHIDGHADLVAIVTAVVWRDTSGCSIEVSWIHNGALHEQWLHPGRLTLVKP